MSSKAISDAKLSASSTSRESFHPKYGRLNLQLGGGGWCAHEENAEQYLEIKLTDNHFSLGYIISAVATQGVLTKKSWVKSYYFSYTDTSFLQWTWTFYHDSDKRKVIHATVLSFGLEILKE